MLVSAVVIPPRGSNDVWSYAAYGRMVSVHDASPYNHVPADFRGHALYREVSPVWRHRGSVYGPVFVGFAAAGTFVAGDSPTATRLFFQMSMAAAVVIALALVWRRTRSTAAVWLGLHPLFGAALVNGGHIDALVGLAVLVSAMQAALALGAASVVVTDVNPHRATLARELGATEALDVDATPVSESGLAVDVLLECSGHPGATADAIRAVAPAGTVVLVGMGGDEMTLPVSRIQERELTVTGTFRYAHTWPAAIALAASGRVQLDRLVTGHYGLDRVAEALSVGRSDVHAVKPVVRPGS